MCWCESSTFQVERLGKGPSSQERGALAGLRGRNRHSPRLPTSFPSQGLPAEGHADPRLLGFALALPQPAPSPRGWMVGWCHPMALEQCYKCWWHSAVHWPLQRGTAPISMSSALFPVCVLDRFALQPWEKGPGLVLAY